MRWCWASRVAWAVLMSSMAMRPARPPLLGQPGATRTLVFEVRNPSPGRTTRSRGWPDGKVGRGGAALLQLPAHSGNAQYQGVLRPPSLGSVSLPTPGALAHLRTGVQDSLPFAGGPTLRFFVTPLGL